MEFTSEAARASYDALLGVLDATVIGLDFDGTLAPVVDDPAAARLHPAAADALLGLAPLVRSSGLDTPSTPPSSSYFAAPCE